MPQQPTIAQVAAEAGATRADVVRVLTEGGTTDADWAIARTIERLGGRKASELVLLAGRDRMIAQVWGDSGEAPTPVAPTNPRAVHDPEVRIYPEATAPDAPNTVLPNHPHTTDTDEDEVDGQVEATDPGRAAWNHLLHTRVRSTVAALTGVTPARATPAVRPWATARAALAGVAVLHTRRTTHTAIQAA